MYILNANFTMRREWEKSQKEEGILRRARYAIERNGSTWIFPTNFSMNTPYTGIRRGQGIWNSMGSHEKQKNFE